MITKIISVLMALTVLAFPAMASLNTLTVTEEQPTTLFQIESATQLIEAPVIPVQSGITIKLLEEPIIEPCSDYILCWNNEPVAAVLNEPIKPMVLTYDKSIPRVQYHLSGLSPHTLWR